MRSQRAREAQGRLLLSTAGAPEFSTMGVSWSPALLHLLHRWAPSEHSIAA